MNKLFEFLKTYKYAVVWTIGYIIVTFFVLYLLFGFNIFNTRHWAALAHARLHGFSGFALGIMILAAVPMYVASTTVIVRTKKPLGKLLFEEKKKEEPGKESVPEPITETPKELPENIPGELRGAFMRARQNVHRRPVSVFEMKDVPAPITDDTQKNEMTIPDNFDTPAMAEYKPDFKPAFSDVSSTPSAPGTLPIPDDFDFAGTPTTESGAPTFAPVFKDINFGESKTTDDIPVSSTQIPTDDNEIVIENGMAIITHNDSDFWIADDENWFASGKQKPSPIQAVMAIAEKNNVTPAIRLVQKNIMDLDSKITQWQTMGITIID